MPQLEATVRLLVTQSRRTRWLTRSPSLVPPLSVERLWRRLRNRILRYVPFHSHDTDRSYRKSLLSWVGKVPTLSSMMPSLARPSTTPLKASCGSHFSLTALVLTAFAASTMDRPAARALVSMSSAVFTISSPRSSRSPPRSSVLGEPCRPFWRRKLIPAVTPSSPQPTKVLRSHRPSTTES